MNLRKCRTCPYQQGLVKCRTDPCIECRSSGRKTHPFPAAVEIHEGEACAKCGSNRFVNGRCAVCGARQRRRWL